MSLPPLEKLPRWVTSTSVVSSVIGAALAVAYALVTLDRPEGTGVPLVVITSAFVVVASILGDRGEQARLRELRRVASGAAPADEPRLALAAADLLALPDTTFWIALGYWCGAAVLIGGVWVLWTGAPAELAIRISFIGVAVGPVVSLLSHLLVLARARTAVRVLAGRGLSAAALYRAVPPTRQQLAPRLAVFGLISVLTPLLLLADMALARLGHSLELARMAADPEALEAARVALAGDLGPFTAVVTLVLVMTSVCAWQGASVLSAPMAALARQTQAFAEGALEQREVIVAEDEVWAASVALGTMAAQLDETVRRLAGAGLKLGATVEELQASAEHHRVGTQEQRGSLTQTSTTTEELARSARQVAATAAQVAALAQQSVGAAREGKRSADAFFASIVQVREGNQAVADSVVKLNKRVQQVGKIVDFIDGIADRSDLLALNAELEGTKAGEVGLGFSLVAAEMRRLSESVMSSTREIARLIEEIRDATNAAVMATEAGVKATDVGKTLAQKVSRSFDAILENANLTSDAVRSISLATQQQQAGTDQLALAMGEVLKSTDEGARASEQMTAANADLAKLARELKDALARAGARGAGA